MALELRYMQLNTDSKGLKDATDKFVKGFAIYDTDRKRCLVKKDLQDFVKEDLEEKVTWLENLAIFADKMVAKNILKTINEAKAHIKGESGRAEIPMYY